MGDDFQLSKGGGPVSFEGEIIDPGATPGDVLTIQDDGSVAAEAGGGGGTPLTVTFPELPGNTSGPLAVAGLAFYVAAAAEFIGDAITFVGEQAANGAFMASGVVDADNNFTDGLVLFTYTGEGPAQYSVISGVATRILDGLTALDLTGNTVQADAATNVTCNGFGVTVGWLVAAPPAWANDTGQITEAGLYQIAVEFNYDVAATTPGLYLAFNPVYSNRQSWPFTLVPIDQLGNVANIGGSAVIALTDTDLPMTVSVQVTPPTDVSAVVTAQVSVNRLASQPA